ncbi:hypothetical protein CANARDRAFT_25794 [[Candida] arabinofermentans NRRL YB-2248]|uniref:Uncharacterized protein n=1 Tax=[Candida] arabinofermentans NRRL YB-2248 TaxID=983967 RepID=A0A1E4SSX9_9ASCO|nr:hypothetical protein CANARDRAFT_25794 [[Candida] arabinofermentans NRRL YB-2248]
MSPKYYIESDSASAAFSEMEEDITMSDLERIVVIDESYTNFQPRDDDNNYLITRTTTPLIFPKLKTSSKVSSMELKSSGQYLDLLNNVKDREIYNNHLKHSSKLYGRSSFGHYFNSLLTVTSPYNKEQLDWLLVNQSVIESMQSKRRFNRWLRDQFDLLDGKKRRRGYLSELLSSSLSRSEMERSVDDYSEVQSDVEKQSFGSELKNSSVIAIQQSYTPKFILFQVVHFLLINVFIVLLSIITLKAMIAGNFIGERNVGYLRAIESVALTMLRDVLR